MVATLTEARDDINTRFQTDWNSLSSAAAGYTPEIRWEGTEIGSLPDASLAWARVSIKHTQSNQMSLGSPGTRRFERWGYVTVQIFTPLSRGQGLSLSEQLATIARNAFEGQTTPKAVWFRRVTVKEIGIDGPWENVNVIAAFCYDEIR